MLTNSACEQVRFCVHADKKWSFQESWFLQLKLNQKDTSHSPSGWQTASDVSRGVKTRRREGKPMDVRKRKK